MVSLKNRRRGLVMLISFLPLPSGVPVPMCFCGDPCKVWILDVCKLCLRSTSSYDPHWVDGENLSLVFNYFDII